MAIVTTVDHNTAVSERQAEALVTLLETFHPRSALKPHLVKLKAIVKDLELVDELPQDAVLTCTTSTSTDSGKDSEKGHPSEEENAQKPTVETGILEDCDVEEEDDDEVAGLMTKLKASLSFSPQNSLGSTTVLRDDEVVPEASVDGKSFGSMRMRTFNMNALSRAKRPGNEHLSPTNKPPTPMKSSSRSPTQQQQHQQLPALSQSPSRCGDRYRSSNRFLENNIQQQVFGTSSILARILEFDGCLAAYHKNYDLIEGYKHPYRRRRHQLRFQERHGTNQLAFVNRKFHSLIIGPEGLEEWKKQAKHDIDSCKRIARQISRDENPSPLAKIFAIVIRNDAIEFDYLLKKHIAFVQQGTSISNDNDIFGMALKEYVDGESMDGSFDADNVAEDARRMGLSQEHPFLKFVKCWQAREFYYTTLLAELAYNAIIYGAHEVLSVLSSKHNTLFSTPFGSKGNQTLLGKVVARACAQPVCTEEICQGIRTLMAKQRYGQEELHANQKGSHGNSLHLAAAKGDRGLVDALMDVGFDPSQRCDERALPNEPVEGSEKLWYPEDWARVRGHKSVVKLLSRRRKQIQQQRRQIRKAFLEAHAEGNDESTAGHQTVDYETITANDTLTADYGSSSCSSYDSDYDSEDDTFEEGPTFEEDTYGDDDDDSTEFDVHSYRSIPRPRRR